MSAIPQKNNVKLIENKQGYLSIIFNGDWYQEDISALTEQLLSPLMLVNIQEKNIGADRENVRFSWQSHFFVLNFDCYSQSCWLEGQDDTGVNYLETLCLALTDH